MELDALLDVIDRAGANLEKLETIWQRAEPQIPNGPVFATTSTEYEDLARTWRDLLTGLPPIDGCTVTAQLPDPAAIGQSFIGYLEFGEGPPLSIFEERLAPERGVAA